MYKPTERGTYASITIIVIIVSVFLVGGLVAWKYFGILRKEIKEPSVEKIELNLATTKLATIPDEYEHKSMVIDFSPDGKQVAYHMVRKDGKELVVINDKQGKVCQKDNDSIHSVVLYSFRFSPNGKHYAYIGTREEKEFMIFDCQESKLYDSIDLPIFISFFSPDSKHFAYVAHEGEKSFVVFDGKVGKSYDEIALAGFSSDSKHFAYVAHEGEKSFVVFDGKVGKSYDEIALAGFSSDSKHFAYVGLVAGKAFMVVDNHEREIKIPEHPLWALFSPNLEHLIYAGPEDEKEFVVFDGKKGKKYDSIEYLIFSPDSKRFAYVATEGEKQFIVVDGKEKKPYYFVVSPTFSPDSKSLAYVASSTKIEPGGTRKVFVVLDDSEGRPYDTILYSDTEGIVFSPDSKHIAYIASEEDKGNFLVLDQSESNFPSWIASIPVFSPDSRHTAFAFKDYEGWTASRVTVVVDGRLGKDYYNPSLFANNIVGVSNLGFSPDNRYLYYGVRDGNELWWIVEEVE